MHACIYDLYCFCAIQLQGNTDITRAEGGDGLDVHPHLTGPGTLAKGTGDMGFALCHQAQKKMGKGIVHYMIKFSISKFTLNLTSTTYPAVVVWPIRGHLEMIWTHCWYGS